LTPGVNLILGRPHSRILATLWRLSRLRRLVAMLWRAAKGLAACGYPSPPRHNNVARIRPAAQWPYWPGHKATSCSRPVGSTCINPWLIQVVSPTGLTATLSAAAAGAGLAPWSDFFRHSPTVNSDQRSLAEEFALTSISSLSLKRLRTAKLRFHDLWSWLSASLFRERRDRVGKVLLLLIAVTTSFPVAKKRKFLAAVITQRRELTFPATGKDLSNSGIL
jgi:hypothetical protein